MVGLPIHSVATIRVGKEMLSHNHRDVIANVT